MHRVPILVTAAAVLVLPAVGAGGSVGMAGGSRSGGMPPTTIGTGAKTCALRPGADCRGVVQRWNVENHGSLRKANFTRAELRGADFRGADLRGADFRGATLRFADLRGARLKGVRFDTPVRGGKQANAVPSCAPSCQGADLSSANISFAQLYRVNFSNANLSYADLTGAYLGNATLSSANLTAANLTAANLYEANASAANFTGANLSGAHLSYADLAYANLASADLDSVTWFHTTCPDGTVTSTGC